LQELDVTPYAINHQVTRPITHRFLKDGLTYLPCCDVRHVHPLFLTCVIYAETINFIAITSILLCKIMDFFLTNLINMKMNCMRLDRKCTVHAILSIEKIPIIPDSFPKMAGKSPQMFVIRFFIIYPNYCILSL